MHFVHFHTPSATHLNTFVQHKLLYTSLVWRCCRWTSGRVARSLHSSCTHYIQSASKLNSIVHTKTHALIHLQTFIAVPFTTNGNLYELEILLRAYGCCWCCLGRLYVRILSLYAKQHGPPCVYSQICSRCCCGSGVYISLGLCTEFAERLYDAQFIKRS